MTKQFKPRTIENKLFKCQVKIYADIDKYFNGTWPDLDLPCVNIHYLSKTLDQMRPLEINLFKFF